MKLQKLPYVIERNGVAIAVNYLDDPRERFCETFNHIDDDCPPGKAVMSAPAIARPITPQEAQELASKLVARKARSARKVVVA